MYPYIIVFAQSLFDFNLWHYNAKFLVFCGCVVANVVDLFVLILRFKLCDAFQSLECLVRLASVRRSLFTNDATRTKFLDHLISGTKEILRTGQGMKELFLKLFQFIRLYIHA